MILHPDPGYHRGTVTLVRSPHHVAYAMGMVRRRTRRRTMLVAGVAAYAAGRATRGGQDDYEDQPPPAPPPPAPTSAADDQAAEIQRLADLHASGALTDEEFAAAKAKILGI